MGVPEVDSMREPSLKKFGASLRATLFVASAFVVPLACSSTDTAPPTDVNSTPTSTVPTERPPQPKPDASSPPVEDATTPPDSSDTGSPTDAGETCQGTPPSNACGLVPQCGCADTETCDIADLSGNVACVAFGKAPLGSPCTTTSGCAKGLSCIFGTCHPFCETAGAVCPGGSCLQLQSSQGDDIPNYKMCTVQCDLRDATACGGMTAAGTGVCSLDGSGGTDCRAGGNLTEKQTCSESALCGPGLACISYKQGTDTRSECLRWCHVGTKDCGGTTTCQGFSTKLMVDGVEIGVCP